MKKTNNTWITLAAILCAASLVILAFTAGLAVGLRGDEAELDSAGGPEDQINDPDDQSAMEGTGDMDGITDGGELIGQDESISVDWLATPEESVENPQVIEFLRQVLVPMYYSDEVSAKEKEDMFTLLSVETIGKKSDDGARLQKYSVHTRVNDMCGDSDRFVYVLEGSDKAAVLSNYAFEDICLRGALAVNPITFIPVISGVVASQAVIEGLESPSKISLAGGASFEVYSEAFSGYPALSEIPESGYRLIGNDLDTGTPIYLMSSDSDTSGSFRNLAFIKREDGLANWYSLNIPFMTESNATSAVPKIFWNDGTLNTVTYFVGQVGGCGFTSPINIADESVVGELVQAGTYSGGLILEPKVLSNDKYVDWYVNFWKNREGHREDSFEDYRLSHPVFYWRDQFGRLVEFIHTDAMIQAECGKPVIYLYPEKTTDIDVSLKVAGGFSITEPLYNNGWRVTAEPNGQLTNRDDGKKYPYLFWEGRGGYYAEPNQYWVIEKSKVPAFLDDTLTKLGLNAQEEADFVEFWLPRMQAAPYYKIGFHGTSVMNSLAPLSLSTKADTLIRILMDYTPLNSEIKSNPPKLPTTPPVRRGFTVIEWGGVLR